MGLLEVIPLILIKIGFYTVNKLVVKLDTLNSIFSLLDIYIENPSSIRASYRLIVIFMIAILSLMVKMQDSIKASRENTVTNYYMYFT